MKDTKLQKFTFRKAVIRDARDIHSLIIKFAKRDDMLPRPLNEIYENIREFVICTDNSKIIAACALHILWETLAEIRSVAVLSRYRRRGIGTALIKHCLTEAKSLGVKKVFALTYAPEFFTGLGFKIINKNKLPHKIWGECMKCHKFPECDETAVIKNT